MLNISKLSFNGMLGFTLMLAIALFGTNHRWSLLATLLALLLGCVALFFEKGLITADQKKLLNITYAGILTFSGTIWILLWFQESDLKFYDNYSRLFLLSPLIYFIVRFDFSDKFIFWGCYLGVGLAIYNIIFSYNLGDKARLDYFNALSLGNIAAEFFLIFAGLILFSKRPKPEKYILVFLCVIIFCLALITGTKGIWLTIFSIMLLVFLYIGEIHNRIYFLLSVFLVIVTVNYVSNNMLFERVNAASDAVSCLILNVDKFECDDSSVTPRLWMWDFALNRFFDSPWFGHSPDSFQSEFKNAANQGEVPQNLGGLNNPHNDFMKILYDFGLLGLIAFFALIAVIFRVSIVCISKGGAHGKTWGYVLSMHLLFSVELGLTQSNFAVSSQAYHFAFFSCLLLGLAVKSIRNCGSVEVVSSKNPFFNLMK